MAKKACPVWTEPSLPRNIREEYGLQADLYMSSRTADDWFERSDMVDEKYLRMIAVNTSNMIPMDPKRFFEVWGEKIGKWIEREGEQVFVPRKDVSAPEQGVWAAVGSDYLISRAQGLRQMAENFIASTSTPDGGLSQGLQFANALELFGQIGKATMGLQQATGLGPRNQGLTKRGLVKGFFDELEANDLAKQFDAASEKYDKLREIREMLRDPRKQQEGLRMLMQEAERVKLLNNPINIVKGALGYKLAGNAWNEWTINSILSNPATLVTNMVGVAWAPLRAASQLLGSGMYNVTTAAGFGDPAAARELWAMSTGQMAALFSAYRDAAVISWEALKNGRSLYDNWALDGSPDLRAITGANAEQFAMEKLGMDSFSAGQKQFFDTLGFVTRLPSRGLLAADEFAKILAQRGEVAQRGIKKAMDAGVDPGDTKAIKDYTQKEMEAAFEIREDGRFGRLTEVYDNASGLQEGFGGRTVKRIGDEATFQEPNPAATLFNNFTRKLPVFKPFIPFVKTPTNIIKQGVMESTLLGPLMKVPGVIKGAETLSPTGLVMEMHKQMLKDPTQTARVTGQITFMTGVMATMYTMAMQGNITGGGPARWGAGSNESQQRQAQEAWERANVPYSFRWGDDTYIPFDRFPEPFAMFMRMAADLGQASAYMSENEKDDAFGTLVGVSVTGLYNSSMLDGVDRLLTMVKDVDYLDQRFAANTQRWVATQTPLGGLMSWLDQAEDPYRSAYQKPNIKYLFDFEEIFGRGVLGKVAERFPGGSSVRPVQIDQIYGQPVPVSPGFGPNGLNPLLKAIPWMPRQLKGTHDEAWKAVTDMTGGWNEYSPSTVELSVGQQQNLNKRMGELRIGGKTLSQALLELRRRPDVEAYVQSKGSAAPETGTGIANEVSNLRTQYGQAAFAEMLSGNVNLQQQLALQQQLKTQKRNNNVAGARSTSQQLDQLLKIAGRE